MIASHRVLSGDLIAQSLDRWVEGELAPWRNLGLSPADVETRLREDYERMGSICLYRIEDGQVEIDPSFARDRPVWFDRGNVGAVRAAYYLDHLREAVRIFGVGGRAVVGINVGDLHLPALRGPTLFFQKPPGYRGLLLPDIDLLVLDYCTVRDLRFADDLPFEEKSNKAFFVGATTGDSPLTARHVQELSNARLAAAVYFRDREDVIFDLPAICQEDSVETKQLIEALDVGGQHRGWPEQQSYRYQMSLDGNGATCGRVAVALHSKSVLLKYASLNGLYYFKDLKAWEHYIPINDSGDVFEVLSDDREFGAPHKGIVDRSRLFAQGFLSRIPILSYTARLLRGYIDMFGQGGHMLHHHQSTMIDSQTSQKDIGARWTEPGHWAGGNDGAIEEVILIPTNGIAYDDVRYKAVGANGRAFSASGGRPCGTRGEHLALHGLAVELAGEAATRYELTVHERFADGRERSRSETSEVAPHSAPMTAFRFDLQPKDAAIRE